MTDIAAAVVIATQACLWQGGSRGTKYYPALVETRSLTQSCKTCRVADFFVARRAVTQHALLREERKRFDGLFGEINRGLRKASKVRFTVQLEST